MELLWITILAGIFILRGLDAEDLERTKRSSEKFCSKGWLPFGDLCYKGFSERQNFDNAEKNCVKERGHLVAITSMEIQKFLEAKIFLELGKTAFIGLNESVNASHWTDGSPLTFTNWDVNEPSGKTREGTGESCGEIVFKNLLKTLGKWNDISCDHELPYICQKLKDSVEKPEKITDLCTWTAGGIYFKNSCYFVSPHRKTWKDAEKYCMEQYNGHLISVTDVVVQNFVHYEVENQYNQHGNLWIGIQLKPHEVDMWTSGWYLGFTNWRDEPKRGKDSSQSCAAMLRGSGQWEMSSCDEHLSFICENSTVIPPPRLNASVPGSRCPPGESEWTDLGGDYCYIFDTTTSLSWYEANFRCMRKGGTLVIIHSKDEEEVLAQFVRYSLEAVHIGLFRHQRSQAREEFQWVDNSPLDYTNWRYGEPNSKDEVCGEAMPFIDMKWNDKKCENSGVFMCSTPKVFTNRTAEVTTHPHQKNTTTLKEPNCECLPTPAIVGVVICVLLVVVLLGVVLYNVSPWKKARQQRNRERKTSSAIEKERRQRKMVVSETIYENENWNF